MNPLIQSIKAKLVSVAKKNQLPYERLFTHFMLERIVSRLVTDPTLEKHLVFKGGFVCVHAYHSSRFTIDIDTALYGMDKETAVEKIKERMQKKFSDHVWFGYENSMDLVTQGEYGGHRLIYKGGLGDEIPKKGKYQSFHIDIGIGDPITPAAISLKTGYLLGSGDLSWRVYPPETILAEKLHTLVIRGDENSRAKDIYDIYIFLPRVNPEILMDAISSTFSHRGDLIPESFSKFLSILNREKLRLGWTRSVASIRDAKSFDETFDLVIQYLKEFHL